jgi:hypothetical protein
MKSKYLSAAAALLCAAGLAACGGSGNGSMSLGVQVFGLDRSGLVVTNDGEDLAIAGTGNYYFTKLLAPDSSFNVAIKTTPSGVTCTLANNTGKINYYTYLQTTVSCAPVPYTLGGTVTGLRANGLVLANGSLTIGLTAGTTSWEFGSKINNGAVYGVTVLTQPAGQTCTVANGTGTMPQANVSNVVVTCQ